MKKILILIILAFCSIYTFAQADRQYVRNGNRLYRQQNFVKAEAEYRKSLSANPENTQAMYNLGCALLMQGKDSAAVEQFEKAGRIEKGMLRKAKIYHNIGFVCQSHRMYGDAINAYKESLRNNPDDDETRYNLALCKRLNKSNKNNKNQDKSNDKKQNKDKDKKQNKDKQQDKDKQQNDKQKDKQQQGQQMSKDNAEQLLNAAMQNEQSTRQRIKDAMRQNGSRKLQKNW